MKGIHFDSPYWEKLAGELLCSSAKERIEKILSLYQPNVSLACSFSKEDLLVADMMLKINPAARIFAIDTHKLPKETLQCARKFSKYANCSIEWHAPTQKEVEQLVREWGEDTFKESVEARKACCHARKLKPLGRSLMDVDLWITGLRRGQGDGRKSLGVFSAPDEDNIGKLNPLFDWNIEEVDAEIERRGIPTNSLYESGYTSIGCEPCTRPIREGEGIRDGRWWWENSGAKECGLHL